MPPAEVRTVAPRTPALPDPADQAARAGEPFVLTDTAGASRAFVDADSLSAFQRGGERLQELFGDPVFVRQDSTRIRSARALRSLTRREILFTDPGGVRIFERGDTLVADTVRYDQRRKIGYARGNVRLTDGEIDAYAPRATYYADAKRSVFPERVLLVDSARTLSAQAGVYFSDAERAEFFGEVRLTDPTTRMAADSVTYFRDTEVSVARGDVFLQRWPDGLPAGVRADSATGRTWGPDQTRGPAQPPEPPSDAAGPRLSEAESAGGGERTYLFGRQARLDETQGTSEIEGDALLIQIRADSTGAPSDTLMVRAARMTATRSDTLRRLVADSTVRIWQSDLAARADSAVYDRIAASSEPSGTTDSVAARAQPAPPREETRLFQTPVAWFEQTQVTGDTIRVVARSRSLDTVYVQARAFAAQLDTATQRLQQLKGRTMTAQFRGDSLRSILATPNGQILWFHTDDAGDLKGAMEASGDRVWIRFFSDSTAVRVYPGVQTRFLEADEVPDGLALEGLNWRPDARPQRAAFVEQERVRRWLPDFAGPPKPGEPPPAALRPDSLQTAAPARTDSLRAPPNPRTANE
jgi:lipopolysaccharide export system protein LptA